MIPKSALTAAILFFNRNIDRGQVPQPRTIFIRDTSRILSNIFKKYNYEKIYKIPYDGRVVGTLNRV
jgi:hypothetical protein